MCITFIITSSLSVRSISLSFRMASKDCPKYIYQFGYAIIFPLRQTTGVLEMGMIGTGSIVFCAIVRVSSSAFKSISLLTIFVSLFLHDIGIPPQRIHGLPYHNLNVLCMSMNQVFHGQTDCESNNHLIQEKNVLRIIVIRFVPSNFNFLIFSQSQCLKPYFYHNKSNWIFFVHNNPIQARELMNQEVNQVGFLISQHEQVRKTIYSSHNSRDQDFLT